MTEYYGWRVLLVSMLMIFAGCHTVPVTGRKTIDLVDDKSVVEMSKEAFAETKKKYRVSTNPTYNEMLERVGSRIAKVVFWDATDADWEFVVFDAPNEVNAFAMAGGKVGVFSGIFDLVDNEAQLASVVAHEIAHVTAKHIHEKLSQELMIEGGGYIVGVTAASGGLPTSSVLQVYGLGTGVAALGWDRDKESEADQIGMVYMAKAGYDPAEAIKLMEKMEAGETGSPGVPAYLSTHPAYPERILKMTAMLPRAEEVYNDRTVISPTVVK
ncbi:MAG: M48 family metallopeptidase [Opitutaceae bacterium]